MKSEELQMAYESALLWVIERWKMVAALLGLGALGGLAVFGLTVYNQNCERQAHTAYVEFRSAVDTRSHKESADPLQFHRNVIEKGESFLARHASSSYANTVRGMVAQSLSLSGNNVQAQKMYQDAADAENNADVKQMFTVSALLIALDIQDDKVQVIDTLKSLASDENSAVYDLVLYRLGEYYWSLADYAEARLWWGQLIAGFENKKSALDDEESPWVTAAREKMSLIDYR